MTSWGFSPKGAVGDQEEVAQLDGEPLLRGGPEAAETPVSGQQRGQRGHPAVHPQQEQLPDTHVQPPGRERQPEPAHLSAWLVDKRCPRTNPAPPPQPLYILDQ